MSADAFTHDEAHRHRELTVERKRAASLSCSSLSRVIAKDAVRQPERPCVVGHLLIIARAAEFEATADWHEARAMCGFEAAR